MTSSLLRPFINLPLPWLRIIITQFVKRFPWNARPLLGIPKAIDPKGISLFLSSLSLCPWLDDQPEKTKSMLEKRLIAMASLPDGSPAFSCDRTPDNLALEEATANDSSPVGWGYHFPWQGRDFYQPAWAPTVVCTSFVLDALELSQSPAYEPLLRRASAFVLNCLNRHHDNSGLCFSYSPRDSSRIFNASLFGAKILSRLNRTSTRQTAVDLSDIIKSAVRYVLNRQNEDGSWYYGDGAKWRWIDGFHTGYVLDSLIYIADEYAETDWREQIREGLHFYFNHLFMPDGKAKAKHSSTYPLDPHSYAQGILTSINASSFGYESNLDPRALAASAVDELWDADRAGFIYHRGRWLDNTQIYSRWSQAWMLNALCRICLGQYRSH